MCCGKGTAKCILVIFNSIFFLLGAALLSLGIFVLVDKSAIISALTKIPDFNAGETIEQAAEKTSILQGSAYAIIGVGAAIFVIGFCGCCGALKESQCLLLIYATLVFVILAAQVAAGVVAYFFTSTVETYLQEFLSKTIKDHYTGATFKSDGTLGESIEPISGAWDFTQAYFECCGNQAYTDFETTATKWPKTYTFAGVTFNARVPVTCCKMKDPSKFPSDLANIEFVDLTGCLTTASSTSTNIDPCYTKVKDLMKTYSTMLMGVAVAIAAVEILGILAACMLRRSINNETKVQKM